MQIQDSVTTRQAVVELPAEDLRPESESLIVHVLFIDLVGYSKLSMEAQKKASCELADCVAATSFFRSCTENKIITCMDTGDGMAIAFEGDPTKPAYASVEIADCRGHSPERPIRMGIHSGPVTRVRDINGKNNFKGVGMNVAQRVMDCAVPGEITMTEHYASILRSYEGWDERIVSLGTYTVKHGLKLRVCELRHPFSPRLPMSVILHRDIPPLKPLVRWTAILLVLSLFFSLVLLLAYPVREQVDQSPDAQFNRAHQGGTSHRTD